MISKSSFQLSNSRESITFWFTMSIIFVASLISLYFFKPEIYITLAKEDNLFESATALFYFVAGLLLVWSGINEYFRKKILSRVALTLILGIFFLFIAGEEISWGQRVLGIETLKIMKNHNTQQEITFHNLSIFVHSTLFDQHRLLNIFALITGAIIPVFYYFHRKSRHLLNLIHFPVVPVSCALIFVLGLTYGQTISKIYSHWAHPEVKEFIFSVGYFLFSISLKKKQNILK